MQRDEFAGPAPASASLFLFDGVGAGYGPGGRVMARDGYRECPVCFEEIKAKARVCRFCGAVLTDEPLPQLLPIEQARALEEARAEEEAQRAEAQRAEAAREEAGKEEKAHAPGLAELTKEEEAALEDLRRVVGEQYGKLEDSLAVKHRLRLEEFLQRAEEEYRTASVLFVDVTGYTALSEKIRPEYLKRILDSFYEICTQIVGAYNGFVVKFEGDACLAVFGAPVAYDRDTESAVRAALEIREMVRTFPVIQNTRISVSAAIATGEILSSITRRPGRVDFDVFGPAVNLAARIEAAAESDTLVVCPETYGLVKGVFEFRPIAPREFKNIAEPVATYEALGIKTEGLTRRDFSMLFVGRERELARLSRSWESFLASLAGDADKGEAAGEKGREPSSRSGAGRPHGHVFIGGPGLGKTRLAMEFLSRLSVEIRLLNAECNPHDRNNPYALWRQAISRLWQGRPNDPAATVEGQLGRIAESFDEEGSEACGELLGLKAMFGCPAALKKTQVLGPSVLRRQIQADLRNLLGPIAARVPVVLFLDDLQWADASSLEVLDGLASPPSPRGVFLLLSHRPGFALKSPALSLLGRIRLEALRDEERTELVRHLVHLEDLAPEIVDSLKSHSSGNPLYLIEVVRDLLAKLGQAGDLAQLRGRRLVEQIHQWVPASLKGMLQSRIDLLDHDRKLVLQCGAVLGHRFSLQLIELFDMIREGLLERLYSLKGLDFIEDVKTPQDLEFLFRHHLIRESAYQSLLERQRREFHRVIALRMEESLSANIENYYPALAYHFTEANERERGVKYLRLAGCRAARQAAAGEAINLFDKALELLLKGEPSEEDQRRAGWVLKQKADQYLRAGQYELARELFDDVLALPACRADRHLEMETRYEKGWAYVYLGDYAKAEEEAKAAGALAEKMKDFRLATQVLSLLGTCAMYRGQWRKARQRFEEALPMARDAANFRVEPHPFRDEIERDWTVYARGVEADVLNNLALTDWKLGRLGEALESFHTVLRIHRRDRNQFGVALVLMNSAMIEENMGECAKARRHYGEALALAERIHFAAVRVAAHANLGNLALLQKRWAEAMDQNARSLDLARTTGDRRSQAIALENLALGHLALGESNEFGRCLKEGRKIAREIGDRERLFSLDLVEIESLLARDNPQEALDRLAPAEETLEGQGFEGERPRLLRLRTHALTAAGRTKEAEKTAQRALRECAKQRNGAEEQRLKGIIKAK